MTPAGRLAALNDAHRRRLVAPGAGGQTMMTRGVAALPAAQLAAVLRAVATFDAFTPDNDPYGEHDCAVFTVAGHRLLWKIDYYADAELRYGAEDPATECYRVLTVMLASEY